MKTALIILLSSVAFILLTVIAAGYYMYRFAVVKSRKYVNAWESGRTNHSWVPEEVKAEIMRGDEYLRAKTLERVEITSFDGLRLVGHVLDREAPAGVVILVHGYRSCSASDFGGAFEMYDRAGFAIILIDHRAHGYSEGKHIGFGVLERYDIVDWAKYVEQRWQGVPLVLDGVSMGASVVMMGAEIGYPDNVKAIIADCGYTTPDRIAKKVLRQWFRLPPFPLYPIARAFIKLFAGYDIEGASSLKALEHVKEKNIGILIAHGKADDFVPYEMSEDNMAVLEGYDRAELFTSEKAGHGLSFLYNKEEYVEAIKRLFERAGIEFSER